jgi:hypothetical protein
VADARAHQVGPRARPPVLLLLLLPLVLLVAVEAVVRRRARPGRRRGRLIRLGRHLSAEEAPARELLVLLVRAES